MILLTLAIVLAVTLAQPAGQRLNAPGPAAQRWASPRTAWGDPDLRGVWTSDNNFSIPLERPAEVAGKVFLDGKDLEEALFPTGYNNGLANILSAARAEERER